MALEAALPQPLGRVSPSSKGRLQLVPGPNVCAFAHQAHLVVVGPIVLASNPDRCANFCREAGNGCLKLSQGLPLGVDAHTPHAAVVWPVLLTLQLDDFIRCAAFDGPGAAVGDGGVHAGHGVGRQLHRLAGSCGARAGASW